MTYGLSRDFEPRGLVPLAGYLPDDITLGYPTELRHVAVGPLVRMIADMQAAGLRPFVISGYRSYSAQAIAREKWAEKEPDRVNILSAPPGSVSYTHLLAGGQPGAPGHNTLLRDGAAIDLPGKTTLALRPGDVIRIETPGGGGWGSSRPVSSVQ